MYAAGQGGQGGQGFVSCVRGPGVRVCVYGCACVMWSCGCCPWSEDRGVFCCSVRRRGLLVALLPDRARHAAHGTSQGATRSLHKAAAQTQPGQVERTPLWTALFEVEVVLTACCSRGRIHRMGSRRSRCRHMQRQRHRRPHHPGWSPGPGRAQRWMHPAGAS